MGFYKFMGKVVKTWKPLPISCAKQWKLRMEYRGCEQGVAALVWHAMSRQEKPDVIELAREKAQAGNSSPARVNILRQRDLPKAGLSRPQFAMRARKSCW